MILSRNRIQYSNLELKMDKKEYVSDTNVVILQRLGSERQLSADGTPSFLSTASPPAFVLASEY